MKTKLIIITFLLLVSACTKSYLDETIKEDSKKNDLHEEIKDYSFIQKITYTDENSTSVIIKNKITKKATVDLKLFLELSDFETEWFNATEMLNLSTAFACGLFQMAFFNETALNEFKQEMEEFNKQLQEWNSQNYTMEDDSPPEQKDSKLMYNPLKGYKVTKFKLQAKEKSTNRLISECDVWGASDSDINYNFYIQ